MGCLYRISFPNGKGYIGITSGSADSRFSEHRYNAASGRGNHLLHKAIRKHGVAATVRALVQANDWGYLCDLERKAIGAYGTRAPSGYNSTDGGEGALGYRHTPDSLKKMGLVHKGKAHHAMPHTAESRAKMSASRRGVRLSEEHKKRISAALVGNQRNLGKHHSPESKAKLAAAHKGRVFSEQHRANISRAALARESRRRVA